MLKQCTMRMLCRTVAEYAIVEYSRIQCRSQCHGDSDGEAVHQYQCLTRGTRHYRTGEHGDFVTAVFCEPLQRVSRSATPFERLPQQLSLSLESCIVKAGPASNAVDQFSPRE